MTEPQTAPVERVKKSFSVHPIALVLLASTCGLQAVRAMRSNDLTVSVSTAAGTLVGTLLISVLPAWVVWHLSRGRRSAATTTLIIMLVLVLIGSSAEVGREGPGVPPGGVSARQDEEITAILTELSDSIVAEAHDLQAAYLAFSDSGGFSPKGLKVPGNRERRLARLTDVERENDAFEAHYGGLETRLRTRLRAIGLDGQAVDYLVSRWSTGARPDLVAQLRQIDREVLPIYRSVINLLADHQGNWEYDSATDKLSIDDEQLSMKYAGLAASIDAAAAKTAGIQKQVAAIQQSGTVQPKDR